MSAIETVATSTPDNLIAGPEMPLLTTLVLLLKGKKFVRGSVIGIITASGKGTLVDKTSSDGSQVAKLILADDVDATAVDTKAVCYKTGLFNRNALTFGGESNAADHEAELRDLGIYLKEEY